MKTRTTSELEIMINHLNEKFDSLSKLIQENTEITKKTLEQATKTNGRVNIIEPLALHYGKMFERIKGATILISTIGMGVVTGTVLLGKIYLEHLTNEIKSGVVQELENKYNIEYEKNNNKNK